MLKGKAILLLFWHKVLDDCVFFYRQEVKTTLLILKSGKQQHEQTLPDHVRRNFLSSVFAIY